MAGRRSGMRLLLASLAIALLGLGLSACGGSGKGAGSSSQTSSKAATTAAKGGAPAPGASTTPSTAAGFMGDEDDDDTASNYTGNNRYDNDADFDNDTIKNKGYYDGDDGAIRSYGHAASAADRRTIAALVKRYYAAAAASDGAKACPLIYSTQEEAIPEDYGRPPGPAYARGKTCAVVMSKMFAHAHNKLAGGFEVTGVRVEGREARALLGSRTVPARFVVVTRERGAWKIDELIGQPLP
jgi:hypothetical protein